MIDACRHDTSTKNTTTESVRPHLLLQQRRKIHVHNVRDDIVLNARVVNNKTIGPICKQCKQRG